MHVILDVGIVIVLGVLISGGIILVILKTEERFFHEYHKVKVKNWDDFLIDINKE